MEQQGYAKYEYRNPNVQNIYGKTCRTVFWRFKFGSFDIVLNFEIRISDLKNLHKAIDYSVLQTKSFAKLHRGIK